MQSPSLLDGIPAKVIERKAALASNPESNKPIQSIRPTLTGWTACGCSSSGAGASSGRRERTSVADRS
jgi:hypothetical protein